MKNLILLTFLFSGFFTKAQQQELFDNDWYLTMITVDGKEFSTPASDVHVMPPNEEITISYFTGFVNENLFYTVGCNAFSIDVEELDDNSFTVLGVGFTLEECMYPLYSAHDQRYMLFFRGGLDGEFPLEGFSYEILNNSNNTKTLVITNPIGDKVYYNNSMLSTLEVSESNQIQLAFQNKDLIIKSSNSIAKSVLIYDLNGKLLLNSKIENDKVLTSKLSKGIYILKISDEKGNIFSKKVSKN